jgi:hypothetical protein
MAGQPLLASHGSRITAVTYQSNHHVNPQEKDNHHVAGFTHKPILKGSRHWIISCVGPRKQIVGYA